MTARSMGESGGVGRMGRNGGMGVGMDENRGGGGRRATICTPLTEVVMEHRREGGGGVGLEDRGGLGVCEELLGASIENILREKDFGKTTSKLKSFKVRRRLTLKSNPKM